MRTCHDTVIQLQQGWGGGGKEGVGGDGGPHALGRLLAEGDLQRARGGADEHGRRGYHLEYE